MMKNKIKNKGETSMNEKGFQFRTAAFGGFRKEDVLAYLEQSSKAHAERVNALQRELEQLKTTSAEDQKQNSGLSGEVTRLQEKLAQLTADLTAVTTRKNELELIASQLQDEVEAMRPSAEAYEAIKERTAGIELEAHGRAQAIEEEGRQKVKALQDQVLRWFEKVCAAYERMRGDIDATMNHAVRELARTHQNFQDISGDFTTHDKTLEELRKIMEDADVAKRPPEPLPIDPEEK